MLEILDFFKLNYFLAAYGITLIISLITYKKYYNTVLKHFPILIAYAFLNELLGYFIRYSDDFSFFSQSEFSHVNSLIYNLFDFFFFGYFYYIYWKLTESIKIKKLIVAGAIVAIIANIINAIFYNPLQIALFYANAISSWILLSFSLHYLTSMKPYLLWKSNRYNLMFWISISLVVFHLFFPVLFSTGYLMPEVGYEYHFRELIGVLIIIMYSLFSIGFIVCRKNSVR